jgi:hypothetical protein
MPLISVFIVFTLAILSIPSLRSLVFRPVSVETCIVLSRVLYNVN